jgi:hypothetical protein
MTKTIYPFLIAAYPILALAANNAQEIPPIQAWRALLLTEIVVLLILGLFQWVYHSWQKSGILSSTLVLIFFSYGHIYAIIENFTIAGFNIGRHRYLLLFCAGLAVGVILFLRKIESQRLLEITRSLNVFGILVLVFPLYSLTAFEFRSHNVDSSFSPNTETSDLHFVMEGELPDIYYIILDSYGREDILRDFYGIDNSSFIEDLRQRGFYVADQSVPNHVATAFSLASSLNMNYVQDLGIDLPPGTYPGSLVDPIRNSIVRAELESLGYSVAALTSGWETTTIVDADYFLSPDMLSSEAGYEFKEYWLNNFERLLLETTVLLVPIDYIEYQVVRNNLSELANFSGWEGHRQIVLAAFENLKTVPSIQGPKFIFAHIISPHRPYLFDSEGNRVIQSGPTTLDDLGSTIAPKDEVHYYADQMMYINTLTLETIDTILANSPREPVIILQSDTGPAFDMDWEHPDRLNLQTKTAMLSAFYFPDGCDSYLYSEISPVNIFRVLFNCYFDGHYPLLVDRTFFTDHHSKTEYQFIPIEDLLE